MRDRASVGLPSHPVSNGKEQHNSAERNGQDNDDDEEDDDDDPNLLLKPSQYESLICGECVRKSALLSRWAGSPGVRMIVWKETKSESIETIASGSAPGQWMVLGEDVSYTREEDAEVEVERLLEGGADLEQRANPNGTSTSATFGSTALKRARSPTTTTTAPFSSMTDEAQPAPKRVRVDEHPLSTNESLVDSKATSTNSKSCIAPSPEASLAAQQAILSSGRGPFIPSESEENFVLKDGDSDADLFLSEGWRDRWCRCSNVSVSRTAGS